MNENKSIKRKIFSLGDLLVVIAVILSLFFGLFFFFYEKADDSLVAVVSVKGEPYCEIPLSGISEPYEMAVTGDVPVVLYMSSDYVCFLGSECNDKLCVNTGKLTRAGQSSVCLPARVSVKLVSEKVDLEEVIDAVAG